MKVKLLKDIFLTGANIKRAGQEVTVTQKPDGLYIVYHTCCSTGKRKLDEDEYELLGEQSPSE